MHRRSFLLSGCQACVALAVLPALAALEGCSTAKTATGMVEENGRAMLPVADLGTEGRAIIKPKAVSDPVLIAKQADGSYVALLLKCPHKGGPLKETGVQLECSWHHSTFDLAGKHLSGPSKGDLTRYPVKEENGRLVIQFA
jgi:nitrite reductase/ring-hydroxylating ferredoxin subunit